VAIDADGRLGGACRFEGCIPPKALLHVAAVVSEAERAKEWGVDFGEPRISLDPLRKWKQERVIGKLARGLAGVAKAKGVTLIGGRAIFEDSSTLRIEGEPLQKIRFKHAIGWPLDPSPVICTASPCSATGGWTLRRRSSCRTSRSACS
jgi:dihydrolipoamide dehydrogenase